MPAFPIQAWVHAFRLRTLPLALASVGTGIAMSYANHGFKARVSLLTVFTTLFLQILSNLANDFGDSVKGVDNSDRVGPERAMQNGSISTSSMKRGILLFVFLALGSGIWLIIEAFKDQNFTPTSILFFLVGLVSIAASIMYTVGKNPYGYYGFGDLFVFIFFGLVAVLGSYYLNTLELAAQHFLPAIAIGMLSTGVLNLNNMRDVENDTRFHKKTLVVKMGMKSARIYHSILILGGLSLFLIYALMNFHHPLHYLFLLIYPLFILDWSKILKITNHSELDPHLKKLAINTLLLVILFATGIILGN